MHCHLSLQEEVVIGCCHPLYYNSANCYCCESESWAQDAMVLNQWESRRCKDHFSVAKKTEESGERFHQNTSESHRYTLLSPKENGLVIISNRSKAKLLKTMDRKNDSPADHSVPNTDSDNGVEETQTRSFPASFGHHRSGSSFLIEDILFQRPKVIF